ncbi:MAG: type 3 dihydrofolate reductase [Candidatus Blackburnbacteria bacterium]|nr:type 3 dihydrofolate reductase [Candidatus Blackburnbacteria bacterium]
MTRISLIAALGRNRVIGKNNRLPWKLPADLKHFHDLTVGKTVVMGRRTFESIGRVLPNRINIVITSDKGYPAPGCKIVHSVDEALKAFGEDEEVMIIGGASIYEQFLPLATRMYLTQIDEDFEGDAYFPMFDPEEWVETEREEKRDNQYKYAFLTLERKK